MRRIALPASVLFALLAAAPASATTFCVPDFHLACPDNGTNVKQASLATAVTANGSDGQDDKVIIGAHTYTGATSLQATGSDGLEIVGAGAADTVITSSSTGNVYVLDLSGRGEPQSIRNLRIVIPATFPDSGGNGAAAQVRNGTVENVEVESRNPSSTGIYFNAGGVLRDSVLHGTTGSLYYGITPNAVAPGTLTVERSTIETEGLALAAEAATVPVVMRRSVLTGFTGMSVKNGDTVALSDTLIKVSGSAVAVAGGASTNSSVTARNTTIIGLSGDTQPALVAQGAAAPSTGNATVTVSDSIIRGFPATWNRTAAAGNLIAGNATIALDHSNFSPTGASVGDGALTLGAGNLDADPQFAGPADYRLTAGSPSLDAADPAVALAGDGLDLAGLPREANATGKAQPIRDQGAYEFQPPAPPTSPGGTGPAAGAPGASGAPAVVRDTTPPRITNVKLLAPLTQRAGGRVRLTLSEAATVTLTFTRRAGKAKPRKIRITFKGRRAGANTLRVKAGRLPAGRWTLSATAVDVAGNRSKAVTRPIRAAR